MRNFPAVITTVVERNNFFKSLDSDVVIVSEAKAPSGIINKQKEEKKTFHLIII